MIKRFSGFTLIEILIVLSIVSILTTIGLFTFPSMMQNARNNRREIDVEQIRSALESFRNANVSGSYPAALNQLVLEGYLQSIPNDPRTRQPYSPVYAPRDCQQASPPSICSSYIFFIPLEPTGRQFLVAEPYRTLIVTATPNLTITPTPLSITTIPTPPSGARCVDDLGRCRENRDCCSNRCVAGICAIRRVEP